MHKHRVDPTEPGCALGFLAARRLGDPDFAKELLARRNLAGMPLRQDFFVNVRLFPSVQLRVWLGLVCFGSVVSVRFDLVRFGLVYL